ncbi:DUF1192 domain-containing protein [Magnetovibrio blakemorei]|uniref:DUF1192 domain-containing protein n=1 Tax=Magnetovibrio blakemorei TaxID=28181 RepID=A0A1E5QAI7_9PROT|nr:DUF1192 domain-containing protein [Magnetovibrio blakemorei]OEJ68734.1 DUF1192 domain-containing protein [Magnetovibrio blakemorei]
MDTDDLEPRKAKVGQKDLDELSIEAIGEYILGLKAEIERAEAVISAKHAARAGADAFFKS